MSHNHRGWSFPLLPNPQHQPRRTGIGIAPGDWPPLRTLDAIALPPQVMALLPDWLLRLRRVEPADNPVLAVEKLNSLARPLQDADKEILVGAVLTMSSSLHLALDMLQEILPQEKSQERLGEVMCPTLGSLLDSLQSTLCCFARSTSRQTPPEASATPPASTPGPATPRAGANAAGEHHHHHHHHHHLSTPRSRHSGHGGRAAVKESEHSGSAGFSRPQTARTETERFPPFEDGRTAGRLDHIGIDIRRRPAEHLVNALQAEMRVQAAINVAIESLEFAEGQLKMVKEVNRLHGGNFDLLQRHFYQGYNRLLSRALELQWREMGLQSSRDSLISVASVEQPCPQPAGHAAATTNNTGMRARPRQHSISFQSVSSVQSPASTTRGYGEARTSGFQRRPLERRNTIQVIRQEVPGNSRTKPPLRRRMSLADELAMVGEDSESGYQDETSEMASSASEFGPESDLESCSNHRSASERQDESEEHSIYGESTGYESAFENPNEEGDGDRTLNGLDTDSGGLNARSQSIMRPSIE